jgi:ankyrin repeat protein
MNAQLNQEAMREAVARAGSRAAGFWAALRDQDLMAIEGFMDEDAQWALALRDLTSGREPAEWCSFLHRHDSLAALLAHGADPDHQSQAGSLLAQAARSHCLECMDLLILAGAALDAEDARGMTPLVEASNLKQERHVIKCVGALLEAGANPDVLTSQGYFALGAIASQNHASGVERLMDAKADLELNAGDGYTALFYAVDNQARDAAQVLLRNGANYASKAQAESGSGSVEELTPFELASARGDTQTAAMLYSFAEAAALRERIGAKFAGAVRPIGRRAVRI